MAWAVTKFQRLHAVGEEATATSQAKMGLRVRDAVRDMAGNVPDGGQRPSEVVGDDRRRQQRMKRSAVHHVLSGSIGTKRRLNCAVVEPGDDGLSGRSYLGRRTGSEE